MSDGTAWTILVADDNPTARAQIVAILSEVGHDVVAVENGEEARSALSALSFDLAVLDHDMPGARGDELARETGGSPPVIGLSSAGATDAEWAGVGIAGWLQKPVDAGGLAAAVQKAMAADKSEDRKGDPVDRAHLATYTAGDPGLESELAELFRASCERYFSEMSDATEDRVWKNAAHGLKGAARGIGANEVGRLAAFAETLLGDAMLGRRAETLRLLREEADRVSGFFDSYLGTDTTRSDDPS
jgi:CheY-like chemotaxis protein/HPt (histidine-containing phosphotransfer) domain-containing protein